MLHYPLRACAFPYSVESWPLPFKSTRCPRKCRGGSYSHRIGNLYVYALNLSRISHPIMAIFLAVSTSAHLPIQKLNVTPGSTARCPCRNRKEHILNGALVRRRRPQQPRPVLLRLENVARSAVRRTQALVLHSAHGGAARNPSSRGAHIACRQLPSTPFF